ncbi:tail protein [Roseivivax halodurans JCM 10272]|uniref:Tail protein n=1 Tax=Roseivivax halodurans JCM 10272 TaxID=1449350 RepID=X7EJ73_9RHOB|nr:phage tail tape measure protein [Roseivivax halodurans]ETX16169.1 tail protein [Roseivivax halodurans JCM 10272]
MSDIERLEDEIDALEASFGGAAGMAAGFNREMERIRAGLDASSAGARRFEGTMGRGVRRAIDGVVLDGVKLSDALHSVAQSMIDASWRAAVKPVADQVGGFISRSVGAVFGGVGAFASGGAFAQGRVQPFANGGVISGGVAREGAFTRGRVMPFATGGIVTQPTTFPMRGGTGLMGEAGPEAIMPLTRTPDGKLGVRAEGGSAPTLNVTINVSTPDVQGFRRSQSQIAAQMGRALARGGRNR